jgi:hypothetical protein
VIQFSRSTEVKPESSMQWDALVQAGPVSHPEVQQHPLGPGASMTQFLSHTVGAPLPDTVEIVAGVWDDGDSFSDSNGVHRIWERRASMASAYEQAIAFVQKGLDENWTRDQYLEALNSKPNSFAFVILRRNLEAKPQWAEKPRLVRIA